VRIPILIVPALLASLLISFSASAQTTDESPSPSVPVQNPRIPASQFAAEQKLAAARASQLKASDAPDKPDTRTPAERCTMDEKFEESTFGHDAAGMALKTYLGQIRRITNANWKPLIPREADKPFYRKGEVEVCFAVLASGQIEPKSMVLVGRSGDASLDRAAWGAIETSVFPPLPEEFHKPRAIMCCHFVYNPDRRPDPLRNLPKPPQIPGPVAITFGYSSKM
jgi:hypothetical protein